MTIPIHALEYCDDYQRRADRQAYAEAEAEKSIVDCQWWTKQLENDALNSILGMQLPRMMHELDRACKGDAIALDAIRNALSLIEKCAYSQAVEDAAEDQPFWPGA